MQKIIITGNITRDAVINETNGRKAINFSVAVNERYKDKDGNKCERASFYSCTLWREASQSTEISKYIKKGGKVMVVGKPSSELYKDKENKTSIDLRINVSEVELLSKVETDENNQAQGAANGAAANSTNDADYLPFHL